MRTREELKNISRELLGYVRFSNEDDFTPPSASGDRALSRGSPVSADSLGTGSPSPKAEGSAATEGSREAAEGLPSPNKSKDSGLHSACGAATVKEGEMKAEKERKVSATETGTALAEILNEVSACRKCSLGISRIKPVFGVGNPNAEVMFVGEGPGYEEDHRGEPFVGRAGKLLDKMLAAIGLSRDKVYIANIVKCHSMINPSNPEAKGNDRPPGQTEIATCRPYLDRQIAVIRPRCIVALGSVAAQLLLGTSVGISRLRGKWHDFGAGSPDLFSGSSDIPGMGIRLLPIYHPAALLRNPNLKRDTWEDMKMLREFLMKGHTSGGGMSQ